MASWSRDLPGLHSEILSQYNKMKCPIRKVGKGQNYRAVEEDLEFKVTLRYIGSFRPAGAPGHRP